MTDNEAAIALVSWYREMSGPNGWNLDASEQAHLLDISVPALQGWYRCAELAEPRFLLKPEARERIRLLLTIYKSFAMIGPAEGYREFAIKAFTRPGSLNSLTPLSIIEYLKINNEVASYQKVRDGAAGLIHGGYT